MACKDLSNLRFGRLVVIERVENDKHDFAQWLCRCDCGTEKIVRGISLRNGSIQSCGCLCKERHRKTHEESKSRLFHIWQYVKGRCYNKNNTAYSYYGGRGIAVCDEWRNSFIAFRDWALSNGYNDTLTLDRIDSDGNYEPFNCRWINRKAQMRNQRKSLMFTINGITKNLADWCDEYNAPYERVRVRVIDNHWDIVSALTTPPLKKNGQPR